MVDVDPKQYLPGTFGCHEAMHMASVLAKLVDVSLCQHPAIVGHPVWSTLAQYACDTLRFLYQDIGELHMPDDKL